MIRLARRPRVVVPAVIAVWLLAVGVALTAANVLPITHAGSVSVSLPESLLAASIRIEPETVASGAEGQLTVFVTLPGPHVGGEILPSTVEMCLLRRCVPGNGASHVEGNGAFQAKFDSDAVKSVLYQARGVVTLTVDGQLAVSPGRFEGSDSVRVI